MNYKSVPTYTHTYIFMTKHCFQNYQRIILTICLYNLLVYYTFYTTITVKNILRQV